MNNKLSIQDLVSAMTDRYGMDTKSAAIFVKTVFEIIEEYISKDKLVKIKGLGTFKLVSVSDRESINVNTGERILIAGHSKLSFTPDASLKDAVNRPFSDFETTLLRDTTSTEDMERIPTVDVADYQADMKVDGDVEKEFVEERVEVADMESALGLVAEIEEENVSSVPVEEVEAEGVDAKDTSPVSDNGEGGQEVQEEEKKPETPDNVEPQKPIDLDVPRVSEEHKEQDNPAYPMATESIASTDECKCKHRTHIWVYTLLTLLLMAVSYFAGYYHLHDMLEVSLRPEGDVKAQPIVKPIDNTVKQDKQSAASSVSNDTTRQETASVATVAVKSQLPEEDPAEVAKYFPQVKNGEYWIVGDARRVHLMQVGETLYSIAEEELGNRNLVRYLIVFNDFEDPNVIHKDDTIRIPKLVKKPIAPAQ